MPQSYSIDDSSLPHVPGGWCEQTVVVGERTLRLAVPHDPELLLELPETLAEHELNEYIPYWAWLWPAANEMANWVSSRTWPIGCDALELGSGMGLVGLAGAVAGLKMTISDYREEAVTVVRSNLIRNGLVADTQTVDWHKPPARQWPIILACDVLYEVVHHAAIIEFASSALKSNGVCWIGDPGRANCTEFLTQVHEDGRLLAETADGHALNEVTVGQFAVIKLTRVGI